MSTTSMSKQIVRQSRNKKSVDYAEQATPPVTPLPSPCKTPARGGQEAELPKPDPEISADIYNFIESRIHQKMKDLMNEFEVTLNIKLQRMEQCIKEELSNKFEQVINTMEARFSQRLEEKEKEIKNINTKFDNLETKFVHLEQEVILGKKREAEELSQNLLLSGNDIPVVSAGENLPRIAAELIKNATKYHLEPNQIVLAERFGKKPMDGTLDKRIIRIKLQTKEAKKDIFINKIMMKHHGLYINEHLTPEVRDLFRVARQLKKDHPSLIAVLHTSGGIIRAKKTRVGKTYSILTSADLDAFKRDIGLTA